MKAFYWLFMAVALWGATAHAKLNVVATTPDLGAIAREIGGDRIDLTVLARPTEDPHFVDAKPSFIVKLNRADALLEGGAELESGWLRPLIEGARNPRLAQGEPGRIVCSEGIHLLEIPAELDRSKGDVHALGNPHFMTDPQNGKIVAQHVAEAFCRLDKKSCDYYRANLERLTLQLDQKMIEWQRLMEPHQGKRVVTYHNFWLYFSERFGLKMDLYLEPKPGIPPSPSHLAEVVRTMTWEKVRVIAVQPYLNRGIAETVASHTGATVVDLQGFPNGSKGGGSYIEWMDSLVKSLAAALKK